jgi:hypothetical protein
MTAENKSANAVQQFFMEHKIGKSLRKSNFTKQKGFPCKDLLQFLVMLAFTGKNLFRYLQSDAVNNVPFAKDSIYRFLDDCHYNWRRFLLLLSSQIIRTHIVSLTSEKRVNVFIVDDSLFSRSSYTLSKTRCLPVDVIIEQIRSRRLYQDDRGNCVFPCHDRNGEPQGAIKWGTWSDVRYVARAAGSNASYGWHWPPATENCKVVVITESPIDCEWSLPLIALVKA